MTSGIPSRAPREATRAEIDAVFRRAHTMKSEARAFDLRDLETELGTVEVDLDRQTVERKGAAVEVSPQEFKVLRLFLQTAGRALSREDILARCWGAEYEGTPRTVDNFVRSLRVKLEENAEEPRHFLTVRGHGYRFERE